jgi:hypothetical protein
MICKQVTDFVPNEYKCPITRIRGFECVATVPYTESTPALLNSILPSAVDGYTRNTVATKRMFVV